MMCHSQARWRVPSLWQAKMLGPCFGVLASQMLLRRKRCNIGIGTLTGTILMSIILRLSHAQLMQAYYKSSFGDGIISTTLGDRIKMTELLKSKIMLMLANQLTLT